MGREGSPICAGSPLDFYAREISRVCRSTISAEAIASANGIELGLRRHAITELISGKVIDLRPRGEGPFPRRAPFLDPSTLSETTKIPGNARATVFLAPDITTTR